MKRLLPLVFYLLIACEKAPEPDTAVRHEPIVVYASYEDEEQLPKLFAAFTEETGIPVTVRHRREEQNIAELIENRGSPPADVLLTLAVHGTWQASDEGALRPLQLSNEDEFVPDWLRDPDDYWVATGFTPIGIAFDPAKIDTVAGYDDLGTVEGVCLSAPWNAANRSLVANLIAQHGVREAELIVRRWTANKALPAFDTEQDVLEAIAGGRCSLAIVSATAVAGFAGAAPEFAVPEPAHVVAGAIGVGRHARYPDNAQALVRWFVGVDAQKQHSKMAGIYASNTDALGGGAPVVHERNVGVAGAFDEDALNLLERAGWR